MAASALTGALRAKKPATVPESASDIFTGLSPVPIDAFPCLRPPDDGDNDGTPEEPYQEDEITAAEVRELDISSQLSGDLDDRNIGGRLKNLDRAASLTGELHPDEQRWAKLGSARLSASFMSPHSLEALPPPMSLERRMAARSATPASMSLTAVRKLPMDTVTARTPEGRRIRRRLLKGVVVVFVVAGYQGKRFIYERAKALGVRSVILDSADCWAASLVAEGVADMFIPIDFEDQDGLFERVLAAVRKAEAELGAVDAITSFWELSQPLVSRLAETLGLQANPPAAVDLAREKQETRRVMAAAGLPTPANILIHGPQDLAEAAEHVGFPAVIKPISGGASLGVVRVDSLPQLETVYERAVKEMSSVMRAKDGTLYTADDGAESGSKGVYVAIEFMMEQYLDGVEVDVDVVFNDGEVVYGGVTDNWPTIEPYFNETGSNCPSELTLRQQRELCELCVAACKVLGFQVGVLHVEAKYTSHGPHLIEINSRMGGGGVHVINKLVWGVDLVEEQLLAAAGIPSKPYLPKKPLRYLAEYSVNAKVTGYLENDDFLEEVKKDPNLVYARVLVSPGSKVVCSKDGLPTWLYEVALLRPTLQEAIATVKQIEIYTDPKIRIRQAPLSEP